MAPAASDGSGNAGDSGGDGGGGGGGAGIATGVIVPQIVNPPRVTDQSLYHEMVAPAAICTFAGPAVPMNVEPPIVIMS